MDLDDKMIRKKAVELLNSDLDDKSKVALLSSMPEINGIKGTPFIQSASVVGGIFSIFLLFFTQLFDINILGRKQIHESNLKRTEFEYQILAAQLSIEGDREFYKERLDFLTCMNILNFYNREDLDCVAIVKGPPPRIVPITLRDLQKAQEESLRMMEMQEKN